MSNEGGIQQVIDEFYPLPSDDEEYCCNCGTGLSRHERFLCYDCQQDEWYAEEQALYDSWFNFDEDEPESEAGQ